MISVSKNNILDTFSTFECFLSKSEALCLLGFYFEMNTICSSEKISKYIISAQQVLTFLKRNDFYNDYIFSINDFYETNEKINNNCHPDYYCDVENKGEIDLEHIKSKLSEINDYLDEKILLQIETKPVVKKNSVIPQVEEEEAQVPSQLKKDAQTNQTETFDIFASYFPFKSELGKKLNPRKILELGVGNGFFTKKFIEEDCQVYCIDEDESRLTKLRNNSKLHRLKNTYFNWDNEAEYFAIWSYSAILHMKKSEINLILKDIENSLEPDGLAFLSFFYGEGNKKINEKNYTLFSEDTLYSLISKLKYCKIEKIWKSTYVNNKNEDQTRINVIFKKIKYFDALIIYYPGFDTLPKSMDIQKLQLISSKKNEDIVQQKITISKTGNLWFWKYRNSANSNELELVEKGAIKIAREEIETLFFMVYQSIFINIQMQVGTQNDWNLTLTATNNDICKAEGLFLPSLCFKEQNISEYIRSIFSKDDLWLFDGI